MYVIENIVFFESIEEKSFFINNSLVENVPLN